MSAARGTTEGSSMECEPVGAIEIAQRLGVSPDTVYQWRWRQLLPEVRWTVGGRPAWNWPDIQAWAEDTGRWPPP